MSLDHAPAGGREVRYDHHAPEFIAAHRELNAKLRATCPVAHSDAHGGFWALFGYDEVFAAAHDDATFSSAHGLVIPQNDVDRLLPIQVDPPLTARYRAFLTPHLTPRALARHEPAIQADIDGIIERIVERGRSELVSELCNPIPARATMRLLGLDADGWPTIGEPLHDADYALPGSPEEAEALARVRAYNAVIEAEVDERYARPRDDLISSLISSEHAGMRLSRQEVIDMVRLVVFGGTNTVAAALSNVFAILAERSDLCEMQRAEPAAIGRAIEEFLRFEAPIQGFARHTTAPARIGGQDIGPGEAIWLGWGSANHDDKVFERPEQLELGRRPNRHMTFGVGAHRCLGSTLARIELRRVVQSFLAAIPSFTLTHPGVVQPATIGRILGKREVHIRVVTDARRGS